MGNQILTYWLIGAALCFLGFLKWPKRSLEILRPRFVVPLAIFNAIFMHYALITPIDMFKPYYDSSADLVLKYVCLCLCGFWLGFALPIGAAIGRLFRGLSSGFYLNLSRLQLPAFLVVIGPFLLMLLLVGPNVFVAGWTHESIRMKGFFSIFLRFMSVAIDLLALTGGVLVGLAWPPKGKRNIFNVGLLTLGLFLGAQVFFMRFSRGSGMVFVLAFVGASVKFRKINWWWAAVVAMLFVLCAHTGLSGRAVHYRFGGSFLYFKHMFESAIWDWPELLINGAIAIDAFTSAVVTFYGADRMNIGQLPQWKWILNQIPVPRILGLPNWTADSSIIIAGRPRHSFTMSIFGDTYAHFRWYGAFIFVYVGMVFRFIDELVANYLLGGPDAQQTALEAQGKGANYQFINIWGILLVSSYAAWGTGLHNNFRAWQALSFYVFYMLLVAVLILGYLPRRGAAPAGPS